MSIESSKAAGLNISRVFSDPEVHPYDQLEWERRSAEIKDASGEYVFRQDDVEFPKGWSQLATNIVASKYFYGDNSNGNGSPAIGKREFSVKQLIRRVAHTIALWGYDDGYFASDEDAFAFENELTWLLTNQHGAFNSPVWFNVGLWDEYKVEGSYDGYFFNFDTGKPDPVPHGRAYEHPAGSACFILGVEDSIPSIYERVAIEGRIFKYGSGCGSNNSPIRSMREVVSGGGKPSGPISFMTVYDAVAKVTKSGGKVRRAAKMEILDDWHPDILEFIKCKGQEEAKAHALIREGYESNFNGEAYTTVCFQNSNMSVRFSDAFMAKVEGTDPDKRWQTKAVTTGTAFNARGEQMPVYDADMLIGEVAAGTWRCGDPGVHFTDTIQKWHTCKVTGPVAASNPCCFTYFTYVDTSEGRIPIGKLAEMDAAGEELPYAFGFDRNTGLPVLRKIKRAWKSGETKKITQVLTQRGLLFESTPEHKYLLHRGEYVEAALLKRGERLRKINRQVNTRRSNRKWLLHKVTSDRPNGCSPQNRWMWEQVHGPLSDEFEVHHVNEDPTDDRLSNFEIIHKIDHNVLHSKGEANARFIKADPRLMVEVWESIENHTRGTFKNRQGVSVSLWNKYIINHGLKGKIPLARYVNKEGLIQGKSWTEFAEWIDSQRSLVNDQVAFVNTVELDEPAPVYDIEVDDVHNFGIGSKDSVHSVVVSNSEYLFLDGTACNLASLNLLKFVDKDGLFDYERFEAAVRIFFIAQEILVDRAGYPTAEICQNSHDFRPLGLGYCNLGALIMSQGMAYDSDEARAFAAAITAIMHGKANLTSIELAEVKGPFVGYEKNRESFRAVMDLHHDYASCINEESVYIRFMKERANELWSEIYSRGSRSGFRNAQATLLAPTGTIAFMMDCFVGSTMVAVADGRNAVSLKQLADEGKEVDVYASDGGRTVIKRMRNISLIRSGCKIIRVNLDDETHVRCTPDHRFMLRSGEYKRADELKAGDSLMRFDSVVTDETGPLRRKVWMGPNAGGDGHKGNHWKLQYRMFGEILFPGYTGRSGGLIHHVDENPLNDSHGNLMLCSDISEHQRIHWASKTPEERSAILKARQAKIGPDRKSEIMKRVLASKTPEQLRASAAKAAEARTSQDRSVWTTQGWANLNSEERAERAKKGWESRRRNAVNHKVVSVVEDGVEDVYCGSVDDVKNFAIITSGGEDPVYGELSGVFVHNCDTTGIEPDIALVKYKTLAGRGMLKIVNRTVPEALRTLGYNTLAIEAIVGFIEANDTIEGAPGLKDEHLPVFDCAFAAQNGNRSISWKGHIDMMAAVQPFLSGAISKTANVPEHFSTEDIRDAYVYAWKQGLKCVAIYRENSKASQPLNTKVDVKTEAKAEPVAIAVAPQRKRLPDTRNSLTHKFSIGGHEGYVTVGLYPDGSPGELFVTMAKEGSTVGGLMDQWATAVSIGLQYGVPLEVFANKFAHSRYEPSGFTKHDSIRIASSLTDYIAKWLELTFAPKIQEEVSVPISLEDFVAKLPEDRQTAIQKRTAELVEEVKATQKVNTDSPSCPNCGSIMQRAGTCHTCTQCGSTSGCG